MSIYIMFFYIISILFPVFPVFPLIRVFLRDPPLLPVPLGCRVHTYISPYPIVGNREQTLQNRRIYRKNKAQTCSRSVGTEPFSKGTNREPGQKNRETEKLDRCVLPRSVIKPNSPRRRGLC